MLQNQKRDEYERGYEADDCPDMCGNTPANGCLICYWIQDGFPAWGGL